MTTSILGEIHVKTNRFRPRIPAVRPCGTPPSCPRARNARLCRFACKELAQRLNINTIFPEFLFHRQWLFGCKVTESPTKKPSAKPIIWLPRVWVLTQVKSFT